MLYPSRTHQLSSGIRWLGANNVVVTPLNADNPLRVDVRTGKAATADYQQVFGIVSPDLRLIAASYWEGSRYRGRALSVGPLLGGQGRMVAETRDCSDDHAEPFDHYQFVPGRRMVVYLADCGDPTMDIYSMRADGTGVRQLTYTAAHEETPALSPDGSRIAYIRSASIGHGCGGPVRVVGDERRRLACAPAHVARDEEPHRRLGRASELVAGRKVDSLRPCGCGELARVVRDQRGRRAAAITRHSRRPARPVGATAHRVQRAAQRDLDGEARRLRSPRGRAAAHVRQLLLLRVVAAGSRLRDGEKQYVTHSTLWIHGAGQSRRVQLPFRPAHAMWVDGGRTLLVAPPTNWQVEPWTEGDLYRVESDGTLTRLTHGLGAISLN